MFGNESPFTIDAANNLAADLHARGEIEPARRFSEDTLPQARRALGDNHPFTRRAADNLAAVLQALGEEPNQ